MKVRDDGQGAVVYQKSPKCLFVKDGDEWLFQAGSKAIFDAAMNHLKQNVAGRTAMEFPLDYTNDDEYMQEVQHLRSYLEKKIPHSEEIQEIVDEKGSEFFWDKWDFSFSGVNNFSDWQVDKDIVDSAINQIHRASLSPYSCFVDLSGDSFAVFTGRSEYELMEELSNVTEETPFTLESINQSRAQKTNPERFKHMPKPVLSSRVATDPDDFRLQQGPAFHLKSDGTWGVEDAPLSVTQDARFSGFLAIEGYWCVVFELGGEEWAQKAAGELSMAKLANLSATAKRHSKIASRVAGLGPEVPAQRIVDRLYDSPYEWAWKAARHVEQSGMSEADAIQYLYDTPYETAWVIANELEKFKAGK